MLEHREQLEIARGGREILAAIAVRLEIPQKLQGAAEFVRRIGESLHGLDAPREATSARPKELSPAEQAKANADEAQLVEMRQKVLEQFDHTAEMRERGESTAFQQTAEFIKSRPEWSPENWARLPMEVRQALAAEAVVVTSSSLGVTGGLVRLEDRPPGEYGLCSPSEYGPVITISNEILASDNPADALRVIAHESYHGYQSEYIQAAKADYTVRGLGSDLDLRSANEWDTARQSYSLGYSEYSHNLLEKDANLAGNEVVRRVYLS